VRSRAQFTAITATIQCHVTLMENVIGCSSNCWPIPYVQNYKSADMCGPYVTINSENRR